MSWNVLEMKTGRVCHIAKSRQLRAANIRGGNGEIHCQQSKSDTLSRLDSLAVLTSHAIAPASRNYAQSTLRAVPLLPGDLVVAAAEKLDQANAVAEGIGHAGDAAPPMRQTAPRRRAAEYWIVRVRGR
jgi:hypothetical protein